MIDVAKVTVESGKGGNGSYSFRREKYITKGGPDGGDGGLGGSVYIVGTTTKQTLRDFTGKQHFKAQAGENGGSQQRHGKDGEDIVIEVPLGTLIWDITDQTGEKQLLGEILAEDERLLVAQGGEGGRGNVHFKSSTNRTPLEYEIGGENEQRVLLLELRLLADLGLVGLPNAGKSTLLSVLTRAQPKIANYPFTTLEPYLGVMELDWQGTTQRYIMADLPGLIEEASAGKGLGHKFLRHIERCRLLVYYLYVPDESLQLSSAEQVELLVGQYKMLAHELEAYDEALVERPSLVAINKSDLLAEDFGDVLMKIWPREIGEVPTLISAATHSGLEEFKLKVHEKMQNIPAPVPVRVNDSAYSDEFGEQNGQRDIPVFTLRSKRNKPTLAYRPPLTK
jgi:GTP-binding protein